VDPTWLTPVGEPRSFGIRLAQIVATERERPGHRAADCVAFADRFNWTTVGEATLALYEQAWAGRPR
jgi:hypothetical protein